MNKKIVIAGGSGFLGHALVRFLLQHGYDVVVLTRGQSRQYESAGNCVQYVHWDAVNIGEWTEAIDGCYALVNMTGKSVNCLYTKKNKAEILSSRLDSVRVLQECIRKCKNPPQVFVQAGSLAIFGDTKEVRDEDGAHGQGFSVEVCQQWEQTFFEQELPDTRQVLLRIGFALGRGGGALEPLVILAKFNLGGTVGSGKQYISWLHIDDLNEMFLKMIEDESSTGIYNATSPKAVTNREFMKNIRTALGKGWTPPAPTPIAWLGAYLVMRADPSLALTGRNCVPKRLLASGFKFKHTNLQSALQNIIQ